MIFFRQLIVTWSQKTFSKRRNNTSFVSIPTENILWHRWAYQWFLEILVISHSCHECVIKLKRSPKIQIPDESNKDYKILYNQFMPDFKRKTSFLAYSVIWLNILNRNKCDKENKKGQQMFLRRWLFILFACEYFTYQLLLYSTQHDILFYGLNPIHTPILQVIFIAHEYHIITDDIKLCMILLGMQGSLFDVYK